MATRIPHSFDFTADRSARVGRAGKGPGASVIGDVLFTGNPINGTGNGDFIFGYTLTSALANTINGNGAADVVLGDHSNWILSGGGSSFANAFSMEEPTVWSVDENPLFADAGVAHATISLVAIANQEAFFSFNVSAGAAITVDVDFAHAVVPIDSELAISPVGVPTDTVVQLIDAAGNVVATNDNAPIGRGGQGSISNADAFLTFTVVTAGTYRLRVYEAGADSDFEGDEVFLVNVSVAGHAVTTPTVHGNDTINGDDGDDRLFGMGGNDTINGGNQNDLILGGTGTDYLDGGLDLDTMIGGDGNDTLTDLDGESVFDGGLGNDSMFGFGRFVFGATGVDEESDTVNGAGEAIVIDFSGSDVAIVQPGTADNLLQGTRQISYSNLSFESTIAGSQFDDTFRGFNYIIDAGGGFDTLDVLLALSQGGGGGSLGDLILVWDVDTGLTVIGADLGGDILFTDFEAIITPIGVIDYTIGNDEANYFSTGDRDDALEGHGGSDTLQGGTGADYLDGGDGFDWASYSLALGVEVNLANRSLNTGHAAGDRLFDIEGVIGSQLRDELTGNAASNGLDGGANVDTLIGANGNDTLIGGAGADVLDGGGGLDAGSYATAALGVRANLGAPASNTRDAKGDSYTAIENLIGSDFADTLSGDTAANFLGGGGGRDALIGAAGADTLGGGTGRDRLTGGGAGDRFLFDTKSANHDDVIADFGAGDQIALTASAFGLPLGALAATAFRLGTAAGDANDRLIYDQASGSLWFDGNGNAAGGQVLIATLENNAALTAASFVVI